MKILSQFSVKIQYFNDPVFIDRLKEVSSSLKLIKGIPTLERIDSKSTPALFDSPLSHHCHYQIMILIEVETKKQYDDSILTTTYNDSDLPDFI